MDEERFLHSGYTDQGKGNSVYLLTSKPKGRVLILSNGSSEQGKKATRIQQRVLTIMKIWQSLGFAIELLTNVTGARDVEDTVRDFVRSPRMRRADICVIVVVSQIDGDFIVGEKCSQSNMERIAEIVANCYDLTGKPKLLFFHMCSGSRDRGYYSVRGLKLDGTEVCSDRGESEWFKNILEQLLGKQELPKSRISQDTCGRIESDAVPFQTSYILPGIDDMMLVLSSQPDQLSMGDNDFFNIMANVFSRDAKAHSLTALVELLKTECCKRNGKSGMHASQDCRAIVETNHTLRKDLYLL